MLYLAEHDFEVGQTEEESLYFGILNIVLTSFQGLNERLVACKFVAKTLCVSLKGTELLTCYRYVQVPKRMEKSD